MHIIAPYYGGFLDDQLYVFRFPSLEIPSKMDFSLNWLGMNLLELTVHGVFLDIIHSHHPILMRDLVATFIKRAKNSTGLHFTLNTRNIPQSTLRKFLILQSA